jgi:hypothetical protein
MKLTLTKEQRDYFVRMGRKGGKKAAGRGGKARAAKMSPQARSEAARRAVRARWAKGGENVSPGARWAKAKRKKEGP